MLILMQNILELCFKQNSMIMLMQNILKLCFKHNLLIFMNCVSFLKFDVDIKYTFSVHQILNGSNYIPKLFN